MSRRLRHVAGSVAALLALGAVAGCSGARPAAVTVGAPGGSSAAIACGAGRTAAGVRVEIEVERGPVSCPVAMAVERDYARAFSAGKVPGNGGGAPVGIQGWTCQGFNTPQVLATGHASACHKGDVVILAVLPAPGASPRSS